MLSQNKVLTWIGWILTVLVSLMLVFSATMKFNSPPEMVEAFEKQLGYPAKLLLAIGFVELTCVILYLIPQTAVLGAILLTGYLGGAVATHVRIEENFVAPIVVGVVVWVALYLRDPRIRQLAPLRSKLPPAGP